jgi:hypothetical protein
MLSRQTGCHEEPPRSSGQLAIPLHNFANRRLASSFDQGDCFFSGRAAVVPEEISGRVAAASRLHESPLSRDAGYGNRIPPSLRYGAAFLAKRARRSPKSEGDLRLRLTTPLQARANAEHANSFPLIYR